MHFMVACMHSSCFSNVFMDDLSFLQDALRSEEEDDETIVDTEQVIILCIRFLSFELIVHGL